MAKGYVSTFRGTKIEETSSVFHFTHYFTRLIDTLTALPVLLGDVTFNIM